MAVSVPEAAMGDVRPESVEYMYCSPVAPAIGEVQLNVVPLSTQTFAGKAL